MPPGLNVVLGKQFRKDVKVALSNTFGFGGHNASAVFKKVE
jgi:3-oxoacyl-[acyl-carrier-protein] synthase II